MEFVFLLCTILCKYFFQTKQVYLFPEMSLGFVFFPVCNAARFLSRDSTLKEMKGKSTESCSVTNAESKLGAPLFAS